MNATPENTPARIAARIADIIRGKPGRWNQWTWFDEADIPLTSEQPHVRVDLLLESLLADDTCGSTACVAGWAAILWAPPGSVIVTSVNLIPRVRFPDDGPDLAISIAGRNALGLSVGEANWLFDGERSQTRVLEALDWLAEGNSNLDGVI